MATLLLCRNSIVIRVCGPKASASVSPPVRTGERLLFSVRLDTNLRMSVCARVVSAQSVLLREGDGVCRARAGPGARDTQAQWEGWAGLAGMQSWRRLQSVF